MINEELELKIGRLQVELIEQKKNFERYLDFQEGILKSVILENHQLNDRIDKAIKYMDNTFDISSVKDMVDLMNNIEEILKGDK